MAELSAGDVTIHVETDGEGEPVTVFAHGLTNSCMELAAFTPMAPGTKVRFCFRGHGHSSTPGSGAYGYADFARDLEAVAAASGATRAIGTSLGAGALAHLLARDPDRFERVVFLLPSSLEGSIGSNPLFERTAELLETLPRREAIEAILQESGRARNYEEQPGLREFDLLLWQDMNPVGVARAIREVVCDAAVPDLGVLAAVRAPALVIAREGDSIHPASVARRLAAVMPNAEAIVLDSEDDLLASIPMLIGRVSRFLEGGA
ncbi:MAG: alpha/beta fold hydrolase [Actinomycetota bacterium]